MKNLVLASGSPRRKELLSRAGFDFEVRSASIDESQLDGEAPLHMVVRLALAKVAATAERFQTGDEVFVAADTIVVANGRVYGKPEGAKDAVRMLGELLGRGHEVLTGWAMLSDPDDARTVTGVSRSVVRMREAGSREIEEYVRTGEPLDKAGAYAAQGVGQRFIAALVGPLDNVIGLPVAPVSLALSRFGVAVRSERVAHG
jgi:septum formation protein